MLRRKNVRQEIRDKKEVELKKLKHEMNSHKAEIRNNHRFMKHKKNIVLQSFLINVK
eukprot:UN34383